MIARPAVTDDLYNIRLQSAQGNALSMVSDAFDLTAAGDDGIAETVLDGDEILAIFGVDLVWPGRGIIWALLSENIGTRMTGVHHHALSFIESQNIKRLEAYVDVGFTPGHRWVEMLNFEVEGYMRAFSPTGGDMVMYSRIS